MSPDAAAAAAAAAAGGAAEIATATAASPSPEVVVGGGGGGRAAIRWDQILPRRSVRVLLVEQDDSTRQVVAALLRKCGYHVAAVADGMKAWVVMQERSFAFDLVLTEVAMPTLSGIELLSRIVAAEECKNIPVIMMSSQDSIGVVLKCMLKGAVDFLVKPVRKNELCNLWQHVWRRHCMNSQTDASENNAASNHLSANAANGSKAGEHSDEGSDAQSSVSKREMEVQSVEKVQEIIAVEGAGLPREIGEKQQGAHGGVTTQAHSSKASDDMTSGNKFDINRTPANSAERNVHFKGLNGTTCVKASGHLTNDALRIADARSHDPSDPGHVLLTLSEPTADGKCKSSVMEKNAVAENAVCKDSKVASKVRAEYCPSHSPEINIRKQQLNGCTNQEFREKDIFNHSNSSAFSRYGDKRIEPSAQHPSFPSLCIGHRSVYDEDSICQHNEVLHSYQCNTGEGMLRVQVPLNGRKEGVSILGSSSVREDTGTSNPSPRKDGLGHPQFGYIPVPIPVGATVPYQNCAGYGAILQPIYYPQASFMHCGSGSIQTAAIRHASCQSNYHGNSANPSQFDEHNQLEENQQFHHSMQIHRESGQTIELTRIPLEQVNQSASCSQDVRKSSGGTGSGETADANTNTMVALESSNESGVQNCSNKGLDSDRSRREAALIKFRMKRKDRCFEKKVRYHSRKKLAEQRPRVKGQFVSQKLKSATTTDAETD